MRTSALIVLAIITSAALLAPPAIAADAGYPLRPVRLVVPYPPGGGSDITGRAIGNKLTEYLGQTFVIDNRPGATGLIGTLIVARAPADGYTIILADAPHTINSLVYAKAPYDAIRDFTPINLVATSPQALLAHPKFSANTLQELLAMPRAQTEKLAMGSSGLASGPHLVYEWLKLRTGLTLNHVPYKGGGPSLADAAAGQIPLVMNAVPAALPHVRAGRLKVLAITSPQRHPLLPGTPTFVESGVKDFVTFQWYGIFGPAGVAKNIVSTLNQSINKALTAPEVKERFAALTFDSAAGTPDDFRKLLVAEDQRWKDVLRQVKIQLD
jgi:tripartite-type tricarboxylate transporter receptor subunit TctC